MAWIGITNHFRNLGHACSSFRKEYSRIFHSLVDQEAVNGGPKQMLEADFEFVFVGANFSCKILDLIGKMKIADQYFLCFMDFVRLAFVFQEWTGIDIWLVILKIKQQQRKELHDLGFPEKNTAGSKKIAVKKFQQGKTQFGGKGHGLFWQPKPFAALLTGIVARTYELVHYIKIKNQHPGIFGSSLKLDLPISPRKGQDRKIMPGYRNRLRIKRGAEIEIIIGSEDQCQRTTGNLVHGFIGLVQGNNGPTQIDFVLFGLERFT